MRKLILFTFLAMAAALAQQGDPPKSAPSQAKVLTRAELDQLLSNPSKVLLIDVRRPDEISTKGGFPVYLSIQVSELEKHLDEIPKDRVIVTVSNHAGRAKRAAALLESKGFTVAGAAGAETYASEGGQLAKIQAPKPGATAGKK